MLSFLKRAAPLVILAAGQYFVIVSGEFDLSVGSLVTARGRRRAADRRRPGNDLAGDRAAARVRRRGRRSSTASVTTRLRVPSFITTLGMLLILSGAVFLWTGGAPRGALSEEFRGIGRARHRGRAGARASCRGPCSIMLVLGAGASS